MALTGHFLLVGLHSFLNKQHTASDMEHERNKYFLKYLVKKNDSIRILLENPIESFDVKLKDFKNT